MRKWQIGALAFICAAVAEAQETEEEEEEEYEIEEQVCERDRFCIPEEECSYHRRYYCPHRRSDFYRYEDKDIDATWPGKLENSFIEEMMR